MRGFLARCCLSIACAIGCAGFAFADTGTHHTGAASRKGAAPAAPKTHYMVSAILRSTDGSQLKLIHVRLFAGSSDEATGALLRQALDEYPGYSMASTVTSEIDVPPPSCSRLPTLGAQSEPALAVRA